MKKKWMKLLCAVLTCCLLVSALAGCGSSSSGSSESGDDSASTDEIVEITFLYPTMGSTPDDLEEVEAAINEISEAEIGVSVTLLPVSVADMQSEVTRMAASGESLDLLICLGTGQTFVNSGLLMSLDDLLEEYGEGVEEALGTVLTGGQYAGATYYIPANSRYATESGMFFRQDILDKYGLSLEEGETLTYEILDEWFAIIKEGEGDNFYMFSNVGSSATLAQGFCYPDTLGGQLYTGVLTDYEDDGNYTVENFYESEAFLEFAEWMHKWYEAGYINPDSATMTDSQVELMMTGNYLGSFGDTSVGMDAEYTTSYGYDMVSYTMYESTVVMSNYSSPSLAISSTSENPEAAMKFINLMYTNEEIVNLFQNGIEGVHYVLTDEEGIITYPDGVDATTTGYASQGAMYGNQNLKYWWSPSTSEDRDELIEFNEEIASGEGDYRISKAFGYAFNTDEVSTEVAAISDVIAEYLGVIEFGTQDPDEAIPALNAALEAAGLSTVIEANQAQLDEWVAAQ